MKNTTIYDIADKLHVSVSTVSRALKDDSRISKEVTEKVKKAASEMGYSPNRAARSLRTGKSNTIGLIVRDINDQWCASVVPSIEMNCAKQGMGLILCNAENNPEKEEFYLQILHQRRVDGVFILTPVHPTQDPYIDFSKLMPLVLIDLFSEKPLINSVCVDHFDGSFMAAKYLIELGHHKIAFISGPLNLSSANSYVKGFKRAVQKFGLIWRNEYLYTGNQTNPAEGKEAFKYFWQLESKPTAVASGSDFTAIGLMRAAQDFGLQIPEDFSVIGYDDIPLSSLINPPLTTIRQNREKIGEEAMKLLLSEMGSRSNEHQMVTIPPEIIIRQSTAIMQK